MCHKSSTFAEKEKKFLLRLCCLMKFWYLEGTGRIFFFVRIFLNSVFFF